VEGEEIFFCQNWTYDLEKAFSVLYVQQKEKQVANNYQMLQIAFMFVPLWMAWFSIIFSLYDYICRPWQSRHATMFVSG